jgi:hypothetical protein
MFQTLTNVQSGEAIGLLQYIDNRDGNLCVGLRSITYTVGWHNVSSGQTFSWRSTGWLDTAWQSTVSQPTVVNVDPGLWGFDLVKEVVEGTGVTLEVNRANGLITLTVPGGREVQFTAGLLDLLGLEDDGWLDAGTYAGDRPVNFAPIKTLYVHLEQINTTHNVLDDAPSTLLRAVGVGGCYFGDTKTVSFPHAEFKRLQNGTIHELKVSVRDDKGRPIDHHAYPISVVLEILHR